MAPLRGGKLSSAEMKLQFNVAEGVWEFVVELAVVKRLAGVCGTMNTGAFCCWFGSRQLLNYQPTKKTSFFEVDHAKPVKVTKDWVLRVISWM